LSFTAPQVGDMIKIYGQPEYLTRIQPMTPKELAIVRSSMKNGRAHDITLYIVKDDGFIFIAKPFYPPGLFRAPSGGIMPGETFVEGAKREAKEETGTVIELTRFVLQIDVHFQTENEHIDWTSYIFAADYVKGRIDPLDRKEIKEARLIHPREIPDFIRLMAESGSGGLIYRAFLTEEMTKRL
jgi:8-oxo-dGTP pyrophosphatase MutT (NUDIX family)